MRIWIMSDMHLNARASGWSPPRIPDADVAMIAGDVREGLAASVAWVAETVRPHMPAVMVAGNHEFHGGAWSEQIELGRAAAIMADVHLLECDTVQIGGTLFSGATLWSDYALHGEERRREGLHAALAGMRDHRRIAWAKRPWRRFRPTEAAALHARALRFLDFALADTPGKPVRPHVVVTHHAPSFRSVPKRFAEDPLGPAYASNLDDFVLRTRPTLWVHGHVHARGDYRVGETLVVANPLGYPDEATGFDPGLVVRIGGRAASPPSPSDQERR